MKKFLALLLALIMVMSLAACTNEPDPTEPPTSAPTTAPTTAQGGENEPTEEPTEEPSTEPTEPPYVTVEVTGNAGEYTYNTAWSVFPTLWNPHTYETATSADVMGYIEDGFYSFDYNDDMTGFKFVNAMATGDPIDITADYVGQWGIEEGDKALVYKIVLRDDLYWETGEKITANDYVESAKRLLNPAAQNYRADTLYTGDVVIMNAEAYLKQGSYAYSNMISAAYGDDEYTAIADFALSDAGTFMVDGKDVWFILNDGGNWGSNGLQAYVNAGYLEGTDAANLWETVIVPAADENGYVAVTEDIANALSDCVAVLHEYENAAAYAADAGDYAYLEWEEFCYYGANYPEMDFSEVGIFALSDTELVYVLTGPMEGFYLKYGMPSGYLVHCATYDACESIDENGLYSNTYGTSLESTVSYGPYKMVEYQTDKIFKFAKNEYWYGHEEGVYQTTHIEVQKVDNATTRLNMLINGVLDTYGLQKDDFATYSLSDYCYYAEGASVFAMVFNPDMDALTTSQQAAGENINKTILTVKAFREGMALGMNRAEFILATAPAGTPAFGLFSTQHIVDPDAGTGYRTTEIAKQTLAEFWGVAGDIGEGKLYETLDEAVDSLTGYNPELAKQKFQQAYDEAIAAGIMDEDDVIEICIGLPSTSPTYTNGYEFIVNNYTELVKGTNMEGKLTFTRDDTIADNFAGSLKSNQVDMLFYVGWSGMELNPYGLMQAYVAPAYQYDSHMDFTAVDLTIELDGTAWTTSVYNWYEVMNGVPHILTDAEGNTMEYSCGTADADPETRLQILGEMERAILLNYNYIPLAGDASAQLKGMQVNYNTEEYIFGMGFGGIKYMTYNYDDAEWAAFVNGQNGELDYT